MLRVTSKYYIQHMNQKDIAKEEGISVPTVSRMINRAIESGYVKISIDYSFLSEEELAEEVGRVFGLAKVIIVPVVLDDPQAVLLDTCKAAASLLQDQLTSGAVIATAWGNTMKCLASCIDHLDARDVKVVQLNGRCADVEAAQGADDMVRALIAATGGQGYTIPSPVIVDDIQTAGLLRNDSGIKAILDLAARSDLAIFSTGRMDQDSIMAKSGFLDHGLFETLQARGAVGDIASGYFDFEGNIVDQDLADRRISLPLDQLRAIPLKICVAAGKDKAAVLHGAIKGGFVDCLVADEGLGRALLALK